MPATKNLQGHTFHRLTVINRAGSRGGRATWNCVCICGNTTIVISHALTSGTTKSCGCWEIESKRTRSVKHGHAVRGPTGHSILSPTYRTWQNMMTRCYNSRVKSFADYGARGIVVCDRWHTYSNFLADMGERPADLTIERQDNQGPYQPSNCRWATKAEQNRNTRANQFIEYRGVRMTQAEFAREINLPQTTVSYRMRSGWTAEQIASIPSHSGNRVTSTLLDDLTKNEHDPGSI